MMRNHVENGATAISEELIEFQAGNLKTQGLAFKFAQNWDAHGDGEQVTPVESNAMCQCIIGRESMLEQLETKHLNDI